MSVSHDILADVREKLLKEGEALLPQTPADLTTPGPPPQTPPASATPLPNLPARLAGALWGYLGARS